MRASTKLTELEVVRIRKMHDQGVGDRTLSEVFGVHRSQIRAIIRGDNWKDLIGMTEEEIICRQHKNGATLKELAEQAETSMTKIWELVNDHRKLLENKTRTTTLTNLEQCRAGNGNFDPEAIQPHVYARPGSPEKKEALAQRALKGESLWNPDDGVPDYE
jgi:plasmid maintenance system antidote protein VapI